MGQHTAFKRWEDNPSERSNRKLTRLLELNRNNSKRCPFKDSKNKFSISMVKEEK
jgi:hypothetical protein